MNSNQADLIAMLSDCVASLEYVERYAPDLTGYAMRGLRLDRARALIARARGEDAGDVFDEFSAGHPVIEDEQITQEAAYHADKAATYVSVAGMIYDAELERREQEAERDEERSVYYAAQR